MSGGRRAVGGAHGSPTVDLLPRLKRDGCNLLVAGAVSETTTNRATQRLLGSPDLDRKRVLVRTDDRSAPEELLPPSVSVEDPDVRVVQYRESPEETDPLASLARRVAEAVTAFGSASPPLVGSELRLVVTSLDAVVADHDLLATEQFLRCVNDAVASVRGMGHCRYGGARADLSSLPVDRLFDAFVDLRDQPRAAQRLSISERQSTGWLDL